MRPIVIELRNWFMRWYLKDWRFGLAVVASCLVIVMTFYGIFRMGTWLTYKSIEGHIEKKISEMVSADALRK
jgi:hypothetical protein